MKIEHILPVPPEEVRRIACNLSKNLQRDKKVLSTYSVYAIRGGDILFGGLDGIGRGEIQLYNLGNGKTRLTVYGLDDTWPVLSPCWELLRDELEHGWLTDLSKQGQKELTPAERLRKNDKIIQQMSYDGYDDEKIAHSTGYSISTVKRKRKRLGIVKYNQKRSKERAALS